ncbi:MAG: UDP-N-acetylmuramoyl-tripeptide--D-alanyl-D-alanine ligase [Anaerovoracaceae bacterium]
MNEITIEKIVDATNGKLLSGSKDNVIQEVCTDSRTAKKGDLFVPIIGEVHDAHKFIPQAYERGCRAFLVSRTEAADGLKDCQIILVGDTTGAVQDLAAVYLEGLGLKKIAVTGSVGKTSTRDMVHAILSEKFRTGTAKKNFNNSIGVPLTIFSFDDSLEAAVLEMGMDHAGEIHRLAEIIRPDIGIITNVGISHIENFADGRDGILKAKMEITDYFGPTNTLVINSDNDMLKKADFSGGYKLIRVGEEPEADYRISDIRDYGEKGIRYTLSAEGKEYEICLHVPGAHNAVNSALAIAGCRQMGVTTEQAISGLAHLELTGKRLAVKEKNGITVIDDTYNAAPASMKSLIDTLVHTDGQRKIAVFAGMNELGAESPKYHREVGEYAGKRDLDLLITVGEKAEDIAVGYRNVKDCGKAVHFDRKEDLYPEIKNLFRTGDVIAVKGSRLMEMEQVAAEILKEQE